MPVLLRAIGARVATVLASLLASSLVVFLLLQLLPGDMAEVMLGTSATPEAADALRHQLGLDRPWPVRYLEWLGGLVQGDLGTSALSGTPIWELISRPLGVTLWLVVFGMGLSLLFALPLGLWAAMRRRHADGVVVNAASHLGMAVPAFLAGLMLSVLLAVRVRALAPTTQAMLGLPLPANGYVPFSRDPVEWARHLVLPVLALGIVQGAMLTRYVRSAFIEVLSEDYIRTARSIGWTRLGAVLRHGLRPAALQLVTVVGMQLVAALTGAIVIERVFVLPGLGQRLLEAVQRRDLLLVQGIIMLLVALVLVVNALMDICYLLLDPRLRRAEEAP